MALRCARREGGDGAPAGPAAFRRARSPAQIAARRAAILQAAADLFDAEGPEGAGLNAIAAAAGFTKSNLYRYFESREQVLLDLWLREARDAADALTARLAGCPAGDPERLAAAIAGALLARPRFCRLSSIVSSVLEQNVSAAAMVPFKRAALALSVRLTQALHARLPDTSAAQCGFAWTMIGLFLAGLWPAAHPAPAVAQVLARAEFSAMRPDAARDLTRGVRVVLRGIAASGA